MILNRIKLYKRIHVLGKLKRTKWGWIESIAPTFFF